MRGAGESQLMRLAISGQRAVVRGLWLALVPLLATPAFADPPLLQFLEQSAPAVSPDGSPVVPSSRSLQSAIAAQSGMVGDGRIQSVDNNGKVCSPAVAP